MRWRRTWRSPSSGSARCAAHLFHERNRPDRHPTDETSSTGRVETADPVRRGYRNPADDRGETKGAHHGKAHRDRVRDARRRGPGARRARRGPRRRLRPRRVAGAGAGRGVGRGHVRGGEQHGRAAPRAEDVRDLRRLLAERAGGDPVHRACSTACRSTSPAARSPTRSAWQGSTLLTGDLAESVTALKGRHDEVHVIGSLDLVQSLLRLGLVDRLDLWVYPLLLGSGKRVFADGTVPAALRLTESVTYPNGTLHLTYETAGVPTYGTMAVEGVGPSGHERRAGGARPAHAVRNATVGGIRDARTAGSRPAIAPIRMAEAMPPAHASSGDHDGPALRAGVHGRRRGPGEHADDAADDGEQDRLPEELRADLALRRAEGAPEADLRPAFQDRDDHDVGDTDGTHDEGHHAEARGRGC